MEHHGQRIRAIRDQLRLTIADLAERSGEGVSESSIGMIERGEREGSIRSLRQIAAGLGVPLAEILEPAGADPPEAA